MNNEHIKNNHDQIKQYNLLAETIYDKSNEHVMSVTLCLSTWRPPGWPISFAPMAESRQGRYTPVKNYVIL